MSEHTMEINSEYRMEELLDTIQINMLEGEKSSYTLHLPSINWVNIILSNVDTLAQANLSSTDDIPNDFLNIEFVVDSSDDDFNEEDFFHGAD